MRDLKKAIFPTKKGRNEYNTRVKCPSCSVYSAIRELYTSNLSWIGSFYDASMNLQMERYEVSCPICGIRFELDENLKKNADRHSILSYFSVPKEVLALPENIDKQEKV